MCCRFTQRYTWSEVHAFLSVIGAAKNLRPRYKLAPTTTIDVVRKAEGGRELVSMRWGLVPAWLKKALKEVPVTFSARAETVAEKPMFRDAFNRRRCIIPAPGFFEWTGGMGEKVPHLFTAADGAPVLAFAGLWDRWTGPASGDEVLRPPSSCRGRAPGWSHITIECRCYSAPKTSTAGLMARSAPRRGRERAAGMDRLEPGEPDRGRRQ